MIIKTSQFITNSANTGGGILIKNGRATITLDQFSNNDANVGGAIYAFESAAINIVESEVNDNRADDGGAILTLVSIVNISKCNFRRNKAQLNVFLEKYCKYQCKCV